MDFKDFFILKKKHNIILVFICQLSKKSISIPCQKTTIARGLAELFIKYIYRYFGLPDNIILDQGQ
jgi:hypothetical protein